LAEDLITDVRASDLRWQEGELLRVHGEAWLRGQSPDPERAARDLEAAIAVAREQGARAFELRAALSLAKLYQSTGPRPPAAEAPHRRRQCATPKLRQTSSRRLDRRAPISRGWRQWRPQQPRR
jgi:hypothetical protein